MKDIPQKIYLQIGEDCPDDVSFKDLREVTWSVDKQFSNDIEFALQQTPCTTQLPLHDVNGYCRVCGRGDWYCDSDSHK